VWVCLALQVDGGPDWFKLPKYILSLHFNNFSECEFEVSPFMLSASDSQLNVYKGKKGI
jgi:hypothetical protein